ncbi:heavy metal translocating P-type ATPase [Tenacibaculum sp. 190524A05c]|uniref:heavy metal translocating P-type ATPase n=1 Tax=Tenacibaculum platacis TaxID=3137852 RepID=UPI0031FADA75
MKTTCYHCGDDCEPKTTITFDEKGFCCNGCKTVYEIFSSNDLTCYYDLQNSPGATPEDIKGKYDYLENEDIIEKLLEFNDATIQVVNLYIPHIHCSSCIWILENMQKLHPGIKSSQVNFPKKSVRISFAKDEISLKQTVELLSSIGYEPYISLEDYSTENKKVDRSIIYKLGVAGFAFGNVMLMSFPEYFEVNEFWLEQYKHMFRWLMFAFSLPVVFYAAQDYFISAYKGIRSKLLNIDIPIALGIIVLFVRSSAEIILDIGSGFFDSLTGLVFFLLLGKFFQQKTYSYLSFERDYKSYFPIAVTKIVGNNQEENIQIFDIQKGDRLLIRNQEIIPVDSILMSKQTEIDYSFVTGEAVPIAKQSGDKLFAGGKQVAGAIEIEAMHAVEQSYLTQLWSNDVFKKDKLSSYTSITNKISKHFTVIVLSIAVLASLFWFVTDASKVLNVFTAVLIIACPCAIALAAPFTLGNMLHIFGKQKFYLKNASVIERLAEINALVFDKTGTLTTNKDTAIRYEGIELNNEEKVQLKSTLRTSNHPLSRTIYNSFATVETIAPKMVKEHVGKGIEAVIEDTLVKIGSAPFVKNEGNHNADTSVHISMQNDYKGKFTLKNSYRKDVNTVFNEFSNYDLSVVSGDNDGEQKRLEALLPKDTKLVFNQKPEDKLKYIASLQRENKKVAMIGDGLNDAGALQQSDVGVAISEDINVFSPACDAILDAKKFQQLPAFVKASKQAIQIIHYCFIISIFYNVIGLYFAVTGQLSPVIAAILMPLSSISIVVFTTIATNILGRKIK